MVQSKERWITYDQYKLKRLDLVITSIILLICVPFIIRDMLDRFEAKMQDKVAEIYHENIKISEIVLRESGVFPILNGKMLIEVKSGSLRVVDSDCPNHLCMKMGPISSSGQTIICVPNKVFIKIKGSDKSIIDSVTY